MFLILHKNLIENEEFVFAKLGTMRLSSVKIDCDIQRYFDTKVTSKMKQTEIIEYSLGYFYSQ